MSHFSGIDFNSSQEKEVNIATNFSPNTTRTLENIPV